MRLPAIAGLLGGLTAAALGWGEGVSWRASRALTGPDRGGTEVIICLGYRNRSPHRANALNRWRVRAALRSIDPAAPASRVIMSGGSRSPGRTPAEATLMARYAADELGFGGELVQEARSRTTWDNVEHCLPLIGEPDRIKIISNPLHALKARDYLHRQAPSLARRLVRGRDYRFGEWIALKPVFALYGLRALRRARRTS